MSGAKNLLDHQKGKSFSAFNIVFLLRLDAHQLVEVPASFCGVKIITMVKKFIKHGKNVSRHFHQEDKICPKDYKNKKVLFLGPKTATGHQITFSEPFSEARKFQIGEKYPVAGIRLRHAVREH